MKVTQTKFKGCFVLEPKVFEDERGYFMEPFNQDRFNKSIGRTIHFVQDNQSYSIKGVVRALHYQIGKYSQAKLVRVLQGRVLDVAVDLRKDSPTFGEHISVELSSKNKKQLFIPRGFAHGFSVLSNKAEFFYKCDNYYNKESERGILFNDPALGIDWKLSPNEIRLSVKDLNLPILRNAHL
ncbi:dTDP-4-dehydrorhamnose 3,5-epimerase [Ulvibacterium marinum]|uniref:dTDP-4-dehydrorhamnose 3,5-epimerase n=1 Tax=Ulvibacterium marinum TaxID=2419782 RepID=A0A3B0CF98_9FLAO|nr:dTDP-4-dehydrorhamnose 3,5-epimerase [Ulvibacterium marinum]RKN82779.1 dTDP-4-dehydrorhamnose 3,5-epimerase [Ulvibacterium marinum]